MNTINSSNSDHCIEVNHLWQVFGKNPQAVLKDNNLASATRVEIQEKTGAVVAVRDVSFKVKKSELFVIMGLSGSGKSTIIRCLLRLIEPSAGSIFIDGEDICLYNERQLREMRRHKLGMVFQHFGLFPHKTILDNVAYGLKVRGIKKKERYQHAREIIVKVGLKGWEDYLPGALSGGMQQRVGIARALANDPEILLLDEPFSGLDPLIRRQMQDELLNLQSELRKTIVFVTHDLNEALKLGNRIAIMRDGELIQVGTPEEVVTAPANDYVREFVQDASPVKVVAAGSIAEQPAALLYEWQTPGAAMHSLTSNQQDSAFLIDRTGKYLGLVSLERLIEFYNLRGRTLRDAVEHDVPTVTPSTILEDLLPLAAQGRSPIPVVDDIGRFVGEVKHSVLMKRIVQDKGSNGGKITGDTGNTAVGV